MVDQQGHFLGGVLEEVGQEEAKLCTISIHCMYNNSLQLYKSMNVNFYVLKCKRIKINIRTHFDLDENSAPLSYVIKII